MTIFMHQILDNLTEIAAYYSAGDLEVVEVTTDRMEFHCSDGGAVVIEKLLSGWQVEVRVSVDGVLAYQTYITSGLQEIAAAWSRLSVDLSEKKLTHESTQQKSAYDWVTSGIKRT